MYFVIYLFSSNKSIGLEMLTVEVPVVLLLLFSLFMVDFIVKKNELTQQNDFALFAFTLLIGVFPNIFAHIKVVSILVLALLAFRRIISLASLKSIKQKLFDASLYITLAILLDSWMVVYFGVIYLTILVYVSSDYRNWLVPLISFFGIIGLFLVYLYINDKSILTNQLFQFDIKINYLETDFRRILLHSLFTLLFGLNFVIFLLKIKTYSSQKKISFLLTKMLFFTGAAYVLFAKNNTYNTEVLLLFPAGFFVANLLENIENKRISDILLFLLMIVSFLFNFYSK
ncbi:hypothetical protein U8527_01505 [Kordia algicida OT-1]|nr:hypothetical protein [Kordia algicida]